MYEPWYITSPYQCIVMSTNANIQSNHQICLSPAEIKTLLPTSNDISSLVDRTRREICDILNYRSSKCLVIVGPCSVHDPVAVLDYARRLAQIKPKLKNCCIVMRTYFEKPRTSVGWSGYVSDPCLDGSCQITRGLKEARRLLLDIHRLGIPCATEMLSMLVPQYLDDLISFNAVGARTVESQPHRELASQSFPPLNDCP